jgi:hypothetical protein
MKKFFHRVWLFLKHVVAIVVDFIFPILDAVEAILLLLPVPKEIVDKLEEVETHLVHWVEKLKEIKVAVKDAEEKLPH